MYTHPRPPHTTARRRGQTEAKEAWRSWAWLVVLLTAARSRRPPTADAATDPPPRRLGLLHCDTGTMTSACMQRALSDEERFLHQVRLFLTALCTRFLSF